MTYNHHSHYYSNLQQKTLEDASKIRLQRPLTFFSTDLQNANDFVSVFNEIPLDELSCSSSPSPCLPHQCSLSLPDLSIPFYHVIHKKKIDEEENKHFTSEKYHGKQNGSSRETISIRENIYHRAHRMKDALRKKSNNYFKFISNRTPLIKCKRKNFGFCIF